MVAPHRQPGRAFDGLRAATPVVVVLTAGKESSMSDRLRAGSGRVWAAVRRLAALLAPRGRRAAPSDPAGEPRGLSVFGSAAAFVVAEYGELERRWRARELLSHEVSWETDARHRVCWVSENGRRMMQTGIVSPHLLGHAWSTVPGVGPPDIGWGRFERLLNERLPFHRVVISLECGARRTRWIALSGSPRWASKGLFLGYDGIAHDITAQRRVEAAHQRRSESRERAVASRAAQLERANIELDAFARQLAHELRTPIGQVAAIAQLLLGRGDPAVASADRNWLTLQLKSALQMKDTVQALQDLAWSSTAPLRTEEIDLTAVCEALCDDLDGAQRRAPITWRIQPNMRIRGGAAQVALAMRNLLANAAKYTRDAENPLVCVSAIAGPDGNTRVTVADNGVGFDQSKAQWLFEPFVRLHSAEHFQGTGIGLSIVKRVVDCHQGWIRASAEPGRGARFEFALAAVAAPSDSIAAQARAR
jgi:signal transduction histidine kinase